MNWRPNKWIAATLGLFLQPVGLLYVARPHWAAFYLVLLFALGIGMLVFPAIHTPNISVTALSAAIGIAAAIHAYILASKSSESATRPIFSRWYGSVTLLNSSVLSPGNNYVFQVQFNPTLD